MLDELDPAKGDPDGTAIEGVERELRERLHQRALLAKSLDKLGDHKHQAGKKKGGEDE